MKVIGHQTHHTIADFDSIFNYLHNYFTTKQPGLHLFPELFLTGYPLQDLCLQKEFILKYEQFINKINEWSESLGDRFPNTCLLLGGLHYDLSASQMAERIENCIYALELGKKLKKVYVKKLLPNYDIFDEKKYFAMGTECGVWQYQGLNIALMICEDMWYSEQYHLDPALDLKNQGIEFDLVINLSASPFHIRKEDARLERSKIISKELGAPFFYINRVGGEDEILFDGRSLVMDGEDLVFKAKIFEAQVFEIDLSKFSKKEASKEELLNKNRQKSSWESLFLPHLDNHQLRKLNDKECEVLCDALEFGLTEYMSKSGFKKVVIALSGGIDSALVLALATQALGESNVEAIYMQGQYSSPISYELSREMCDHLGVALKIMPIKFLHSTIRTQYKQNFGEELHGVSDENIQSRLRGTLLYARSNQTGAMVINTSNKSEISVGYSTQYGDSVGAISLLGDLYKTEVYALCRYLNRVSPGIIPVGIIDRPPTAELREGQRDDQSLPPYEIMDTILECFLSSSYSRDEIISLGFSSNYVDQILKLFSISEFKRFQFCPIIKLKSKGYGFGHRLPITKSTSIYK
ncbi:MAG: NAD+ synthase [Halobacteriovoraceae bacterium]|nr:NAD+ synthase [Halobacteriovoraceae bacterium]